MSYSNIKHDLKPEKYKLKEEWDILIPRVCLQNLKRQQWIAWWGKGKSIRSSDSWPLCLLGQSLASSPLSLATVTWKWEQSQHLFTLFSQLSSVASDSAAARGLPHARPPCPSPTPVQTHCHQVSDAIQPSHPLSSPSPPAFNLSQHQDLFQWVCSLHHVAEVHAVMKMKWGSPLKT